MKTATYVAIYKHARSKYLLTFSEHTTARFPEIDRLKDQRSSTPVTLQKSFLFNLRKAGNLFLPLAMAKCSSA